MAFEEDKIYITNELARWWKIPSESQIEHFSERVSMMVQDDEMSVDYARRTVADRIIYR